MGEGVREVLHYEKEGKCKVKGVKIANHIGAFIQ